MITTEVILKELRRELATRKALYPRWVQQGRISGHDADHRTACMQAAIERLEPIAEQEKQPTLFDTTK